MLSYQHKFHAGNMADVHKHALLAAMLDYLTRKPKPLTYVETHAGRALYRLDAAEARKTGEAAAGIGRLAGALPRNHPYARCLARVRARHGDTAYPGSPLIAAELLRAGDVMHLAELHPAEHAALREVMTPLGAHVLRRDGFEAALSICPPTPRRGLILIDPSWEVKEDYATVPKVIGQIRAKWNVGIVALWYPLLEGGPHEAMLHRLAAEHPGALRHEVRFGPARRGHRMIGSGMFVAHPPHGLAEAAAAIGALFDALPQAAGGTP
ncbi:MAG: 23S rRNA (adenine(2030)-N(6))-methyltransferase RlmJ [Roseicyclus sp.]